ncbi:MAG: TonB-dependent receptor [Sulfurovum sp.]
MKKTIYLSIACSLWLQAVEVELETIHIETKVGSELIKDVRGEDIKSADLGEALAKHSPSVSLNRRSGIANDITIRGARKDNLNVTIDGTKIHGACPNRMDPPISHILTNSVDFIEINEGPFSVDEFGLLSANVKVHTVKPKEGFNGEFDIGMGSFGYKKGAFSLSGGTDTIKFLLSGSLETSEQYKDGNGDDFAGQIANNIANGTVPAPSQLQPQHIGMDSYTKKTLTAKMFWNITDNQELRLSYTANRSENILYPSSKMDALYDDSNIYNIEYIAKNLGSYSKELSMQVYQTDVEHPMSTKYRIIGAVNYMTHTLTTKAQGAKIKNVFDLDNHTITTGVDYSLRNWDGKYYMNDIALNIASKGKKPFNSIHNVDTKNIGFFLDDSIKMGAFVLDLGLRYDSTEITTDNITQPSNSYDGVNGYILAKYIPNDSTQYFVGVGKSSRVPDAKELYWVGSTGNAIGTPNLKEVINYEVDIGVEKSYENATIKAKVFYSKLQDYIAYNSGNAINKYENVDATIWGFELSGSYMATDSLYLDFGLSMQKGEKESPLTGQTGINLPDISPLKLNLGMNYEIDGSMMLSANAIIADEWSDFDSDNGEQKIDAYGVLNLKATKTFSKGFELTVGVDNVLDSAYAVSNTYNDLILLSTGTSIMLMNEPGRYFYTNLKYKF